MREKTSRGGVRRKANSLFRHFFPFLLRCVVCTTCPPLACGSGEEPGGDSPTPLTTGAHTTRWPTWQCPDDLMWSVMSLEGRICRQDRIGWREGGGSGSWERIKWKGKERIRGVKTGQRRFGYRLRSRATTICCRVYFPLKSRFNLQRHYHPKCASQLSTLQSSNNVLVVVLVLKCK